MTENKPNIVNNFGYVEVPSRLNETRTGIRDVINRGPILVKVETAENLKLSIGLLNFMR